VVEVYLPGAPVIEGVRHIGRQLHEWCMPDARRSAAAATFAHCPNHLSRGRALPGAAAALAAVTAQTTPIAAQSVLTGNVRAMAEMKLHTLRLADHLDLDIGAYGDTAECRGDLVPLPGPGAAAYVRGPGAVEIWSNSRPGRSWREGAFAGPALPGLLD
jgi:hypothetical protein